MQNYIIQEVLKYDPPYDVLIAWLFHNHVCGGSSPGYLISDYIYNEHPLGENESYIYITTNANCKDDVISRLLGVSPGMGNYFNLRYDDSITNKSNVGIIIKWNSVTKTGTVSIVNWLLINLQKEVILMKMILSYIKEVFFSKPNPSTIKYHF